MTEEKTYTIETVMEHIRMYAQMVHLANWRSLILRLETKEMFEEAVRKAENEFLKEFKDKGFYVYLEKMKEVLKRSSSFTPY